MDLNFDDLKLTPEQKAAVKKAIDDKEKEIHEAYDKKAHAFREKWNAMAKEHGGLYVARRAAAYAVVALVALQGLVWYAWSTFKSFFPG